MEQGIYPEAKRLDPVVPAATPVFGNALLRRGEDDVALFGILGEIFEIRRIFL